MKILILIALLSLSSSAFASWGSIRICNNDNIGPCSSDCSVAQKENGTIYRLFAIGDSQTACQIETLSNVCAVGETWDGEQCVPPCEDPNHEDPNGECVPIPNCPVGEVGNYVLGTSGWVWQCFPDVDGNGQPDPVICGVDDGKTATECSCAETGGSYFAAFDECLPPAPNDCDANSSDYQGTINGQPVCSGNSNCSDTETYGLVDGQMVCIPDDYGPPDCDFDTVAIADNNGGYVCSTPEPDPDAPEPPDDPNDPDSPNNPDNPQNPDSDGDGIPNSSDSDVDGDGIPNELDPDYEGQSFDTSSIDAGLSKLSDGQKDTNKQLQNIDLKLNQTNSLLDGVSGNIKELTDYTTQEPSSVDSVTGTTATISETSTRISNAIFQHSFISSVLTIPTVSTNTSCPVFVFPANKFWDAITMDIHCVALEAQRSNLAVFFIGLWTLMAVFVFLKA
jgi:hypothetical protein